MLIRGRFYLPIHQRKRSAVETTIEPLEKSRRSHALETVDFGADRNRTAIRNATSSRLLSGVEAVASLR
jgi:hypothetical protein